jgi:hypothetical protein
MNLCDTVHHDEEDDAEWGPVIKHSASCPTLHNPVKRKVSGQGVELPQR